MTSAMQLSEATQSRFAREVAKFPADQKQSAVMACLSILQQEQGWVSPEGELAVAQYLGMPVMAVHEVTTFYNMYNQKPVGQFKLNVCTNLPCQLRGGQQAMAYLERNWVCMPVKPRPMACSLCSPASAKGLALMRRCSWSTTVTCAAS